MKLYHIGYDLVIITFSRNRLQCLIYYPGDVSFKISFGIKGCNENTSIYSITVIHYVPYTVCHRSCSAVRQRHTGP